MKINGYVEISPCKLRNMCKIILEGVKIKRKKMKAQDIKEHREHVAKATWWGFKSGRKISKKEALEELKEESRESDYGFKRGWMWANEGALTLAEELIAAANNVECGKVIVVKTEFFKTYEGWEKYVIANR